MARPAKRAGDLFRHGHWLIRSHGALQRQYPLGIGHGVERQGGMVLIIALGIGKTGFFLLKLGRIEKQDFEQVAGGGGAIDRTSEVVLHQLGQVAAVVNVRVGEYHGFQAGGAKRQRFAVAQTQLLKALKQPAIDQNLLLHTTLLQREQVFGTRDAMYRAQKPEEPFDPSGSVEVVI